MNNKIFLKTSWFLVSILIVYVLFVVFFLFPKVNNYLINKQIEKEKIQFKKISSILSSKIEKVTSKDLLFKEAEELLRTLSSVENTHYYLFDKEGKVLIDFSNDFPENNLSKINLTNKKNFFNEIKKAYNSNQFLKYNWNTPNNINDYTYEKILFSDFKNKLNLYFSASVYLNNLKNYTYGINTLILNISILFFIILFLIGAFVSYKLISPINKILKNIQSIKACPEKDIEGDEITILSNQFNSLLEQVENNRKIIENHVDEKTKEITNKLYWDEITNLKNRYALEEEIKDIEFIHIALVDIDSFDDINELYGFSAGNLVLKEVGRILKEFTYRYNFFVYRLHGNAFAIVDKNMIGFIEYNNFITELSSLFKNKAINIKDVSSEIFIDITIGISLAQDEPLKTASIALKKAKQTNSKVFAYNNELDTKEMIRKSNYWREKIKRAINNDDIVPFYQAIVGQNEEVIKYEALMRIEDILEDGSIKYISPFLFFEIAIKSKQYAQLSKIMFTKVLFDVQNKIKDKQVTINLSFLDILNTDFNEFLDKAFSTIKEEDKKRLVFEILESDYITDYTLLDEFIERYRKHGVKFAIDDFGTGYSNFAHIIKIKPDYIKIDGSLIKDINTNNNSYELVKSIVEFSKALNIKTIAEFVHCEEVYKIVEDIGVDEFQGYYFAEPKLLN